MHACSLLVHDRTTSQVAGVNLSTCLGLPLDIIMPMAKVVVLVIIMSMVVVMAIAVLAAVLTAAAAPVLPGHAADPNDAVHHCTLVKVRERGIARPPAHITATNQSTRQMMQMTV